MAYCNLAAGGLIIFILLHTPFIVAQTGICSKTSGKYTANSTYRENIQTLATSLPYAASKSPLLFAASTSGTIPDAIYALALCRGDTNASLCAVCVAAAIRNAQVLCPLVKDVIMYDDPCSVRFSNRDLPYTPLEDNRRSFFMSNANNDSAVVVPAFFAAVVRLVNATARYAAADQIRRFGTGEETLEKSYQKIYALAQCTPDLTAGDCFTCLMNISSESMPIFGKLGGRVFGVRCNFRFEMYPFFSGEVLVHLPDQFAPPPEETRRARRTAIVVAMVVIISTALLITLVAWLHFSRRSKKRAAKAPQPNATSSVVIPTIDSLLLDLSTLQVATDDFAEHRMLGEGGFGVVYKGDLPEGQEIAVKRLSQSSRQGIEELKTELVLVAKLNHKNLVRLVGVCLEKHEKILVYEYMPNRSLDTFLFDAEKVKELDWSKRFKIINGITRGLQYLHEDSQLKIVHRDLKASNVLLDSDYNPKISDFGLAKIFGGDQSHIVTHRIAGTFGYMSPEYAMRGQYSTKSDVFSLGVLILEIITGRRNYNSEQDDLINDAWEHWTGKKAFELIDKSLINYCPIDQFLKCVHIGLLCVQQKPADRPLMSAVNFMLSSKAVHLPSPTKPAFCIQEIGTSSQPNIAGNINNASSNEVTITELVPR